MNHEHLHPQPAAESSGTMAPGTLRPGKTAGSGLATPATVGLPTAALDDRIAIVGTAGSGKTYTAKGFVERLLDAGARVTVIDPLGVWWGLALVQNYRFGLGQHHGGAYRAIPSFSG
jgi:DNA helicase HerA-like ATPase